MKRFADIYTNNGNAKNAVPKASLNIFLIRGLDGRATRHEGYRLSQRLRIKVEEILVG